MWAFCRSSWGFEDFRAFPDSTVLSVFLLEIRSVLAIHLAAKTHPAWPHARCCFPSAGFPWVSDRFSPEICRATSIAFHHLRTKTSEENEQNLMPGCFLKLAWWKPNLYAWGMVGNHQTSTHILQKWWLCFSGFQVPRNFKMFCCKSPCSKCSFSLISASSPDQQKNTWGGHHSMISQWLYSSNSLVIQLMHWSFTSNFQRNENWEKWPWKN